MRRLPLIVLSLLIAAAGGLVFYLLRVERPDRVEGPVAPVPAAAVAVPPVPVTVLVPGGEGGVMPVAGPDGRSIRADALKAAADLADKTESTALLVWHNGALQLEHYGAGRRPSDQLDGGGLQDLLPLLLAGQALESGALPGLDVPAATWIPDWAGDPRARITVRDLLQGTSGLDGPPATDDPEPGVGYGGVAEHVRRAPLGAQPGTRHAPSQVELQALALVLTQATGRVYKDLLAEALWQPLGARPARLRLGRIGGLPLACCLEATARDWLRLGLLLLDGGAVEGPRIVPADWLEVMRRPTAFARHEGFRLLSVWPVERRMPFAAKEPFLLADTVFLAGEQGGRLYVAPEERLVVLRLGPARPDWDESRLPNLLAKGVTVKADKGPRARSTAGAPLPPIERPPPVPKVEVAPLAPLAPAPPTGPTDAADRPAR